MPKYVKGYKLKAHRLSRGLSVKELARLTGISTGQLCNLEIRSTIAPREGTLEKLTSFFGEDILGEKPCRKKFSIDGMKLHKIRVDLDMTLEDVADRTGINVGTVSLIEGGLTKDPHPQTFLNLILLFGEDILPED